MTALGALQAGALVWGSGGPPVTQLLAVLTAAALGSLALLWIAFDAGLSRLPLPMDAVLLRGSLGQVVAMVKLRSVLCLP